jgi:hypothetical protein
MDGLAADASECVLIQSAKYFVGSRKCDQACSGFHEMCRVFVSSCQAMDAMDKESISHATLASLDAMDAWDVHSTLEKRCRKNPGKTARSQGDFPSRTILFTGHASHMVHR